MDEHNREGAAETARKALEWEVFGVLLVCAAAALLLLFLSCLVFWRVERKDEDKKKSAAGEVAVSVVAHVIKPETVEDSIRLPGIVRAWTAVDVPAEVSGKVIKTPVADGQPVKKGQPLLFLDRADYEISLRRAEAALFFAKENRTRTENLYKAGRIATQSQMDEASSAYDQALAGRDAAKLALERCVIYSPLDGVADDVMPEVGEYIHSGATVARVLDVSKVKVEIGIPEREAKSVARLAARGGEVKLTVDAVREGFAVSGKCLYLSEETSKGSLVYTLRLEVDNAAGLLRPMMFAQADVVKEVRLNAVVVPLWAVLPRNDGLVAFVVAEETGADGAAKTVARERKVETGVTLGRRVEIVSGLKSGDRLIVRGQRASADGAAVRVAATVADPAELDR